MAEDIMSQLEKDFENTMASGVDKVDQKGLKTVAEIAREVNEKEKKIFNLEQELKDRKKELLKLTDEELPNILNELGISSFKLEDGSTISVKQTYGASIKVENRPAAYQWLRENGYDDIIKNQVRQSDMGTKVIRNILDGDYSGTQIANWFYGTNSLGKTTQTQSIQTLKKLNTIFKEGSDGRQLIKDGAFLRIIEKNI